MPRTPQSAFRLTDFRGVRNFPDGDRFLDPREARSAQNVITSHGSIEPRPGFTTLSGLDGFEPGDTIKYIVSLPFVVSGSDPPIDSVIFAYATRSETDGVLHKWALFRGTLSPLNAMLTGTFEFEDSPSSSFYPQAVSQDGVIYVAAGPGVDQPAGFKIYRTSNWHVARLGIVAPEEPWFLGRFLGQGGGPVGNFSYRYTFQNSHTLTESAPSSERLIENDDPVYSIGATVLFEDDPQVNRIRLYRRQTGTIEDPDTAVDAAWYHVMDYDRAGPDDEGTTMYDTTPADELTKTYETELNEVAMLPPDGNLIANYHRRLWWVPDVHTNTIRWSELDEAENVDARNEVRCGSRDNPITGIIAAFGKLIVLKERSIYAISGSVPATFTVSKLSGSGGCASAATIKEIGGVLYFSGVDHVYRLDGTGAKPITTSLGDSWLQDQFHYSAIHSLSAAHLPWANLYVLNGLSSSGPQHQWAFDYARQAWVEWTLPITAIADHRTLELSRGLMLGACNAKIGWLARSETADRLDAGSQPISWHWETGDLEMRTRRPKKFYHLGLSLRAQPSSEDSYVEASVALGGGEDFLLLGTVPLTMAQPTLLRIGAISDSIRVKVGGETISRLRLYAMDLETEIVGYRSYGTKRDLVVPGELSVMPEGDQFYSINEADDYVETEAARWVVTNLSDGDIEWYATILNGVVWAALDSTVPTDPDNPATLIPNAAFDVPILLTPEAFALTDGQYTAQVLFVNTTTNQQLVRNLVLTVTEAIPGEVILLPDEDHLCEGYSGDPLSFEPLEQVNELQNIGDLPVIVHVEENVPQLPCWSHDIAVLDFEIGPHETFTFTSTFDADCAAGQHPQRYVGNIDFDVGSGPNLTRHLVLLVNDSGHNGDPPKLRKSSIPRGPLQPRSPEWNPTT